MDQSQRQSHRVTALRDSAIRVSWAVLFSIGRWLAILCGSLDLSRPVGDESPPEGGNLMLSCRVDEFRDIIQCSITLPKRRHGNVRDFKALVLSFAGPSQPSYATTPVSLCGHRRLFYVAFCCALSLLVSNEKSVLSCYTCVVFEAYLSMIKAWVVRFCCVRVMIGQSPNSAPCKHRR